MYTALYLPDSENDPSETGFPTEDDAIGFVVENYLCSMCKDEGWGSACAAEWIVVETSKLEKCDDLGDIFDAVGMTKIED